MLSSDQAGEVFAAAAAITRALKLAERDWHDLSAAITSVPVAQPQPPRPKPATKPSPASQAIDSEYVLELVESIRMSGCYLSKNAEGFLDSLEERADRYHLVSFSVKQWEWFVVLLQQASVEFEVD